MIDIQSCDGGSSEGRTYSNEFMSSISARVDLLSPPLRHLSLKIHDNPEVRNKEFIAHEAITTFLEAQSAPEWQVTLSAYGIATAFVAVFDSGLPGPVVSFNAEYGTIPEKRP